MGIFDFLKKKEEQPQYDITNLSVRDLQPGFILEYDMKSWVVKEKYEYDWGQENFSHEYMLDSGDDTVYLGVESRGELFLTITRPIKASAIPGNVAARILEDKKAPQTLVYEGDTYFLDGDSAGYFNDITKGTDEWEELISWEYLTEDNGKIVNLTQWDEHNIDAVAGDVIPEYQISNIIPAEMK